MAPSDEIDKQKQALRNKINAVQDCISRLEEKKAEADSKMSAGKAGESFCQKFGMENTKKINENLDVGKVDVPWHEKEIKNRKAELAKLEDDLKKLNSRG